MSKKDIEDAAAALVKREKNQWEDATVFVTDRVAFQMRNLIRILRKNYWGIFDEQIDPTTGRKKIWYPLTEEMVNAVLNAIDLDTKDINVRAKNENGYKTAPVIRALVRDYLSKTYFGETLDDTELQGGIDGTVVWKTWKENGKICRRNVDLLNFYIDPQADSIQETPAVIERAVLTEEEVKSHTGWMNREEVVGQQDIVSVDGQSQASIGSRGETKFVEVYERWGLMPKWFLTGKKADKDSGELVEGQIVIAGINKPVVLHISANTRKDSQGNVIKPYEEWRMMKIPNRWYGKGIAERVMMLQLWMNTIVNTRINRHYLSQMGIFKIRRGSGITPQVLSKLPSNGAILVNSMDDLEQVAMQEASQSSYTDEQTVLDIARRITSTFQVVTGEGLPASTPATNTVIQDRNAKSAFTLIKESLGIFIQKWVDRQLLPLLAQTTTAKELIRIVGDDDKAAEYYERVALYYAWEKLDEVERAGGFIPSMEIEQAVASAREKMRKRGELFIDYLEKLSIENVDTKVYVTNEEMDVAVTIQNLISMLPMVPEMQNQIARQVMDLMGLDMPSMPERQMPLSGSEIQNGQGADTGAPIPNSQNVTTAANLAAGGVV
jgi:hypothetical protein